MRLSFLDRKQQWDPAALYTYRVVKRWGLAIWNAVVTVEVLQAVLLETALDFCSNPSSAHLPLAEADWSKIADPVQAYVASLARIGWRAVSATEVEDHKGCRWSFLTLCPEAVAKLAAQATAR